MLLNMWWTVLLQVLAVWITYLGVRSRNIFEITTKDEQHQLPLLGANGSLKDKLPTQYSPTVLRGMRECMLQDNRYEVLPFGTVNRIRQLRLNAKKRKHKHQPKQGFKQGWIQLTNKTKESTISWQQQYNLW